MSPVDVVRLGDCGFHHDPLFTYSDTNAVFCLLYQLLLSSSLYLHVPQAHHTHSTRNVFNSHTKPKRHDNCGYVWVTETVTWLVALDHMHTEAHLPWNSWAIVTSRDVPVSAMLITAGEPLTNDDSSTVALD